MQCQRWWKRGRGPRGCWGAGAGYPSRGRLCFSPCRVEMLTRARTRRGRPVRAIGQFRWAGTAGRCFLVQLDSTRLCTLSSTTATTPHAAGRSERRGRAGAKGGRGGFSQPCPPARRPIGNSARLNGRLPAQERLRAGPGRPARGQRLPAPACWEARCRIRKGRAPRIGRPSAGGARRVSLAASLACQTTRRMPPASAVQPDESLARKLRPHRQGPAAGTGASAGTCHHSTAQRSIDVAASLRHNNPMR